MMLCRVRRPTGKVTAVAGGQMIGEGCLFGISLGSSEGSGYVYEDGSLTGWINENAYNPFDLNPDAPGNPWSPHRGDVGMRLGRLSQGPWGSALGGSALYGSALEV